MASVLKSWEIFFKVKKPKELNEIEWLEQLHEMVQEWEEKHGKEFPF